MSDATQSPAPHRLEDLKRKMKLTGTVKKVELFGAFVDLGVGRDGLVHISELAPKRVAKVNDVVKEGDVVKVKLIGMDDRGKVRLSMKVVDQATGEDLSKKQQAGDGEQQAG